MGLDAVELVMDVEEHFGIDISDADVSEVRTLGDLYEIIVDEIGIDPKSEDNRYDACRQRVFQYVKNDLSTKLGIDSADVQPGCLLEDLFPLETRRQQWKKLRKGSRLTYPDLQFPPWSVRLYAYGGYGIFFSLIGVCVLAIKPLRGFLDDFSILVPLMQNLGRVVCGVGLLLILYLILFPIIGDIFFSRLKRAFPHYLEAGIFTVGDLTSRLLWLNRAQVQEEVDHEVVPDEVKESRAKAATKEEVREELQAKARTAFMDELAIALDRPVEEIDENELVETFFFGKAGRVRCRYLYEHTKLKLPDLEYPVWSQRVVPYALWMSLGVIVLLFLLSFSLSISLGSRFMFEAITILACGSAAFSLLLLGFLFFRAIFFQKQQIPRKFATIGKLADEVVELSKYRFFRGWKKEHGLNTPIQSEFCESNEIWRNLRWLVAEQLGMHEDQLTPETDFVRDLGF